MSVQRGRQADQEEPAAGPKVCAVPKGQLLQGRAKMENVAEDPPSGAGGGTREKGVSERRREGRGSRAIEAEGGECPGGAGSGAQNRGGGGVSKERAQQG